VFGAVAFFEENSSDQSMREIESPAILGAATFNEEGATATHFL
jgi:hypothetical protein